MATATAQQAAATPGDVAAIGKWLEDAGVESTPELATLLAQPAADSAQLRSCGYYALLQKDSGDDSERHVVEEQQHAHQPDVRVPDDDHE